MTIAWTFAGSDSGGGAGIQADLHTFQALGVHGCSVITAVTAQNSLSVDDIYYLPPPQVQSQIGALMQDLSASAIKIGMMGELSNIKVIQHFLKTYSGKIILDPVCCATSGKNLFLNNQADYLAALKSLFPCVDLLTPNLSEAEALLNRQINSFLDIKDAAVDLLSLGVKSVLIKGGHFQQDGFCQDYWTDGKESFWLSTESIGDIKTHGTGCTLSAAITACLALGYAIKDALIIGKMYVTQAIRHAKQWGQGLHTLTHSSWPENEKDLPYLTTEPLRRRPNSFPNCGEKHLGIYPVVNSAAWLARLLPLGVSTIQLRIKNKTGVELETEIQEAVRLANKYQARLFINDFSDLALRYQAYGVHLGQEDLNDVNLTQLQQTGLRLGISSHCYYEVARAHAIQPSYIACGPIFATTSKAMPFTPQGLEKLARWRRTLSYPIVAIGGIRTHHISTIHSMSIEGIAMIAEICHADEPERVTARLLEAYNK